MNIEQAGMTMASWQMDVLEDYGSTIFHLSVHISHYMRVDVTGSPLVVSSCESQLNRWVFAFVSTVPFNCDAAFPLYPEIGHCMISAYHHVYSGL